MDYLSKAGRDVLDEVEHSFWTEFIDSYLKVGGILGKLINFGKPL